MPPDWVLKVDLCLVHYFYQRILQNQMGYADAQIFEGWFEEAQLRRCKQMMAQLYNWHHCLTGSDLGSMGAGFTCRWLRKDGQLQPMRVDNPKPRHWNKLGILVSYEVRVVPDAPVGPGGNLFMSAMVKLDFGASKGALTLSCSGYRGAPEFMSRRLGWEVSCCSALEEVQGMFLHFLLHKCWVPHFVCMHAPVSRLRELMPMVPCFERADLIYRLEGDLKVESYDMPCKSKHPFKRKTKDSLLQVWQEKCCYRSCTKCRPPW